MVWTACARVLDRSASEPSSPHARNFLHALPRDDGQAGNQTDGRAVRCGGHDDWICSALFIHYTGKTGRRILGSGLEWEMTQWPVRGGGDKRVVQARGWCLLADSRWFADVTS